MKKVILSIFTIATLVIGTTNFSHAATFSHDAATTLTDISSINKLEIHGNVTVYISDASTDQVKVYNKYYSENALVQSKNGTLRISSYASEKLVVWVSANDLRSVSAYDNAEVKSFGQLSKIEFNVDLHDNASAKLDLNAHSAVVNVSDHAKADLSGSADEFTLSHNYAASVNNYNFSAVRFTENKINFPAAAGEDAIGI
jgi:hypothetical protein